MTIGEADERLPKKTMADKIKTTEPVKPGNLAGAMPEFGRLADVQTHFGLKRGTLYNLLAAGKVRGCLLRVKGQKSGVRLFDMASVRECIRASMTGGKKGAR